MQYQALLNDPQLVSARDDIAVIDSRINDLLRRVDAGESGALWQRLRATYATFQSAQRVGDVDAAAAALAELGDLIETGANDAETWTDVVAAIEVRRKLVATETQRQRDLDGAISLDTAMSLVTALGQIVNGAVTDQSIRNQIAHEVYALIDHDDPPPPYVVD
jgi:hypothetical protein